jgi:hypothetical protein
MCNPLTVKNIEARLRDYPRDNYLFMASVLKGVALGVAAYALAEILADYRVEWPLIACWFTSLTAILVSYVTWGRGVLLTNSKANIGDSVFPLLMGIVEFLLFGVLLKVKEHPQIWLNWFAILGIHSLGAVFLVHNRLSLTDPLRDFEGSLKSLAEDYMKWMRSDRKGACLAASAAFVVWYLVRWVFFPTLQPRCFGIVQSTLAFGFLGILWMVAWRADKQRQELDERVTALFAQSRSSKKQQAEPGT